MKTITATAALTIMFLSAGAFADSDRTSVQTAANPIVNITVISKNSHWPMVGQISSDACAQRRCIAI